VASRLVIVVPSIANDLAAWTELVDRLKTLEGYAEPECRWELIPHDAALFRRGSVERHASNIAARVMFVLDGDVIRPAGLPRNPSAGFSFLAATLFVMFLVLDLV
jgi:hypothetical protein